MKNIILTLGVAIAVIMGASGAYAEEDTSKGWQFGGVRIANPIDPSTW